ncbi:MAG: M20/M25/M40 family metallo-hydrolase, partial [Pseudomonadota bacterium]
PALSKKRTAMPVVPENARQSTLNINSIHGGEPEQDTDYTGMPSACVPDRCRMVIDRRFLAEESVAEVESEILAALERVRAGRPGFDYDIRELFRVLPTMTDRNAPVVGAVANAVRQVFGRAPDYVVSPGTYDQKHIDRIGRLKNCIAYGPGRLDLAHKPDEFVGIDDMVESAQVMALALSDLLKA